jgi:manganese transport protein
LFLQYKGFRVIESLVIGLILIIGGSFAYEMVISNPSLPLFFGNLLPKPEIVTNPGMLYIAVGILGATVMPHNLYLHSSIVQTRAFKRDEEGKKMAIHFSALDSLGALCTAFFINAAILILSAAAFHGTGHQGVADIHDAYNLLTPVLGASMASIVFAVALLASGQNSTLTGTLAGQIVMEGFLNIRLRPWVRRMLTRSIAIVPAAVIASMYGEKGVGQLLIFSQVVLSLQLSFAVVPLVMFTSDKKKMGNFVNSPWIQVLSWIITAVIVVLNVYLLWQTFVGHLCR